MASRLESLPTETLHHVVSYLGYVATFATKIASKDLYSRIPTPTATMSELLLTEASSPSDGVQVVVRNNSPTRTIWSRRRVRQLPYEEFVKHMAEFELQKNSRLVDRDLYACFLCLKLKSKTYFAPNRLLYRDLRDKQRRVCIPCAAKLGGGGRGTLTHMGSLYSRIICWRCRKFVRIDHYTLQHQELATRLCCENCNFQGKAKGKKVRSFAH